ncbi:helix-turn-helix transcriptional regulator [Microbacterium sp. JC 701]|uniref:helix-turn-helix transcriptional regulator n=1 Tax=Microbacterium sp. JC 701 TaxID=2897389 RepID=UPI001E648767|nr:helix-turn-helix transcriptional regulator [Microbacterium sp. JC 701]MCD2171009.1 helix-turn-helix transcriptional regulator [Microbacterium sp. JC 701]
MIDRVALAHFLRTRREALQPEDVGLPRGVRRRTRGLRREEAAALSHMSVDYYARLERERGPQPSEQMLASIAQGLHLSRAERDHLFRLAGHVPADRGTGGEHISPGLLRVLDRLDDTPAEVVTELGETLRQSRLGVALTGDASLRRGAHRGLGYRWFADPASRAVYDPRDHAFLSRLFAAGLRELVGRRGPQSHAADLADDLRGRSAEFRDLWDRHEVGLRPVETKRFVHPSVGTIEVHCQTLVDPETAHSLLVYTAAPGTESAEKLRLLAVLGPSVPA